MKCNDNDNDNNARWNGCSDVEYMICMMDAGWKTASFLTLGSVNLVLLLTSGLSNADTHVGYVIYYISMDRDTTCHIPHKSRGTFVVICPDSCRTCSYKHDVGCTYCMDIHMTYIGYAVKQGLEKYNWST